MGTFSVGMALQGPRKDVGESLKKGGVPFCFPRARKKRKGSSPGRKRGRTGAAVGVICFTRNHTSFAWENHESGKKRGRYVSRRGELGKKGGLGARGGGAEVGGLDAHRQSA